MSDDSGDSSSKPNALTDDSELDALLWRVAQLEPTFDQVPQPGEVIGEKYRLVSLIGRGGMGVVFRAEHTLTRRHVALKWMLRSNADARTRQRFVREAIIAGRVDHTNVVSVYDVGEANGSMFLVMELLHGETLRERLKRAALDVHEVLQLLLPAMRGVSAMHQAGVIHRDLKPDNIFLCEGADGSAREAKVLDFGVSSIRVEEDPGTNPTLTHDGTVLGTPAYMSAEQLENARDADERSDVYSFGVILYEALVRKRPFQAESYPKLVYSIIHDEPIEPHHARPELPEDLSRRLMRALARSREDRYQTMAEMIEALSPFASGEDVAQLSAAASPTVNVQRPARTHARTERLILAAGLVLLAGGIFAVDRQQRSDDELQQPRAATATVVGEPPSGANAELADAAFFAPFDPPPPYAFSPSCVACMEERCHEEKTACDADKDCKASIEIEEYDSQRYPIYSMGDYVRRLSDARWSRDHGESPGWSALRTRVYKCRELCQTAGECRRETNLACVGQFDWPTTFPKTTVSRIRLRDDDSEQPIDGVEIRACTLGTNCEAPLGVAKTQDGGFAMLEIHSFETNNVAPPTTFQGYLLFDNNDAYSRIQLRDTAPLLTEIYWQTSYSSKLTERRRAAITQLPIPGQGQPVVLLTIADCNFWPPASAVIEAWRAVSGRYEWCNDCRVVYGNDSNMPDLTRTQYNANSVFGAQILASPGQYMFIARDLKSKRPFSVLKDVPIDLDSHYSIILNPASRAQLASIPEESRRPPVAQ